MPLASVGPIQGRTLHPHAMGNTALGCFGRIPLIVHQGAQQVRQQRRRSDVDNDGDDGNGDNDGSDAWQR